MAAVEVMGRPQGDDAERVSTIRAPSTIPVVDTMHREAARATFRSRLFHRGGSLRLSRSCQRLATF